MTGRIADCDLCIVGGGDAGFTAALAGAALGLRVVLVDDNATEPCWRNWDVALGVLRRVARDARNTSCDRDSPSKQFQAALRAGLEAAAPDRRFARLAAMNVRILHGRARFFDPGELQIGGQPVRARRIFLATGKGETSPDDAEPLTVERLAHETPLPTDVSLAANDSRNVALAQGLSRLGCNVILRAPGGLLRHIDAELVAVIRRALLENGVTIDESSPRDPSLTARPVISEELGLDQAGITVRDGRPLLSPALRTTNPRVYAVGALAGATSTQDIQAQVAVALKAAFLRLPVRYDPTRIPLCVDTDPALATVGLSEAEASKHGRLSVWRWPFAETAAGAADPGQPGFLKVVTDKRGRILGASIVHRQAAEQIGYWSLAIRSGHTLAQLADVHLPAPAFAEASRRIALQHATRRLQSPWLKRALAVMSRFG